MNVRPALIVTGATLLSSLAYGKEVACIPRTEVGETTTGGNLYERDADLNINNLSRIDFDKLTIISADGKRSQLVKVEGNVFKSVGPNTPYYFVTNDSRSIVTELSVRDEATYIKVLLCK